MIPDNHIRDTWRIVYDKAKANIERVEKMPEEKRGEFLNNMTDFIMLSLPVAGLMADTETKTEEDMAMELGERLEVLVDSVKLNEI